MFKQTVSITVASPKRFDVSNNQVNIFSAFQCHKDVQNCRGILHLPRIGAHVAKFLEIFHVGEPRR